MIFLEDNFYDNLRIKILLFVRLIFEEGYFDGVDGMCLYYGFVWM